MSENIGKSKMSGGIKLVTMIAACILVIWGVTHFTGCGQNARIANGKSGYTILASNDQGMHCMQPSYSSFLILPPGNTIHVQVLKKGLLGASLVTDGISVAYKVNNNTSSADKIDFWKYAADYGFKLAPDQGITGNSLSGTCALSKDKKYFEATAIPVTPYNDGCKTANYYQTATITVRDSKTNKILVRTDKLVVPVSDEMKCSICHGTNDTDANILKAHDENENTYLYADLLRNQRHKCNECHSDNILGAPGKNGVPSLSLAMHEFHADKLSESTLENKCYSCHPGPKTRCLRGAMAAEGLSCTNAKCHGSIENVADTLENGRQAWLQEPDCGVCHGESYAANADTLYRHSYLENGPDEMNGKILCSSCHNSPHAEWKSTLEKDNKLPIELMGRAGYISKCSVCHRGSGKLHEDMAQ